MLKEGLGSSSSKPKGIRAKGRGASPSWRWETEAVEGCRRGERRPVTWRWEAAGDGSPLWRGRERGWERESE